MWGDGYLDLVCKKPHENFTHPKVFPEPGVYDLLLVAFDPAALENASIPGFIVETRVSGVKHP